MINQRSPIYQGLIPPKRIHERKQRENLDWIKKKKKHEKRNDDAEEEEEVAFGDCESRALTLGCHAFYGVKQDTYERRIYIVSAATLPAFM